MLMEYNMADFTNASAGTPLLIFSVITTIYYIIKYNLSVTLDSDGNLVQDTMSNVYFLIYLLLVILSHFFINLNMTYSICGSKQWQTSIFATIAPWTIIFGFLYIGLQSFPSWLMPFSNTIGYGMSLLAGLSETIDKIFKGTGDDDLKISKDDNDKDKKNNIISTLEKLYSDKSLIINEITLNNFSNFWNKMKGLIKKEVLEDRNDTEKKSLIQLIKIKEYTSEFLWYILSGFLITSISHSYIINASCKRTVQEMQDIFNKSEL